MATVLAGEERAFGLIVHKLMLAVSFHDKIYEASNNEKLKDILHELHGISTRFWYYLIFDKEELVNELHDLARVLDALEERDGQRAAEVMANHIRSFVDKARDRIL